MGKAKNVALAFSLVGVAIVLAGVWMFSRPLALILGGLYLCAAVYTINSAAKKPTKDGGGVA